MARIEPIPSLEKLEDFYQSTYSLGAYAEEIGYECRPYYASRVSNLIRRLAPTSRVVCEVGCSSGSLLQALKSDGWDVHGFELADSTASIGRRAGLDIRTGEILEGQTGVADVVILRHCLEHTRDIEIQITRLRDYLKPGGLLVLIVPNYGSSASRIFSKNWQWFNIPEHLWYFSPNGISGFLTRRHLSVKEVSTVRGDADGLLLHAVLYVLRNLKGFHVLKRFASGDTRAPRTLVRRRRPWLAFFEKFLNGIWLPVQWIINKWRKGEELWVAAQKPSKDCRDELDR